MAPTERLPSFLYETMNLRVLQLDLNCMFDKTPLMAFFSRCNHLEELDLTEYDFRPGPNERSVFSHLGKTLRKLRLHENEASDTPRTTLGKEALDMLAETCPKLRALGLDLMGNGLRGAQCMSEPDPEMHDWVGFHLPL